MSTSLSTDPKGALPVLRVRDLRPRKYAKHLRVDADFQAGVNVLLGVNGIGKTTLLNALANPGLRRHGSRVALSTSQAEEDPLERGSLSLLPQHPILPRNLTVQELIRYCCHIRGAPMAEVDRRLGDLGLRAVADRRTTRLSGGERQRLNLALAFVGSPRVVLLDEPTVSLDPLSRGQFNRHLRTMVAEETHLPSDIDEADSVSLLTPAGVSWAGSPVDFLAMSPTGRFDHAFEALLGPGEAC
jgi:ABC-2 type transport system ATP-binding protein